MTIIRSISTKTVSGTVSNTAKSLQDFGFAANDVATADRVIVSVTSGALRLSWDHPASNPPSTSTGLLLPTDNYPLFEVVGRANAASLQMIRDGSSDATISVSIESD